VAEGSGGGLESEELTQLIISAAIKVQRSLGSGLLESAYEVCLAHELRNLGLEVNYHGLLVPNAYRMDLLVADQVLIELKTVEKLLPVHDSQVLTYLRFSGLRLALILNFWAWPLKAGGIKRVLNPKGSPLPSAPPLPSA
jgi:GxxExxY protein